MTTEERGAREAQDAAGRDAPAASAVQAERLAASFTPAWEVEAPGLDVPPAPAAPAAPAAEVQAQPSERTASEQLALSAPSAPQGRGSILKRTLIGTAPPANLPAEVVATAPETPAQPASPVTTEPLPGSIPQGPQGTAPVVASAAVISSAALSASPEPKPRSVPTPPKSESKMAGVTSAAALANAPRGKASDEPKVIVADALTAPEAAVAPAATLPTSGGELAPPHPPARHAPTNLASASLASNGAANHTLEIDEAQILEVAATFPPEHHAAPSPSARAPMPAPAVTAASPARPGHLAATVMTRPAQIASPLPPAFETSELSALVPKRTNTPIIIGVVVALVAGGAFFVVRSLDGEASPAAKTVAAAQSTTQAAPRATTPDVPPPSAEPEPHVAATPTPAKEATHASPHAEASRPAEAPAAAHRAQTSAAAAKAPTTHTVRGTSSAPARHTTTSRSGGGTSGTSGTSSTAAPKNPTKTAPGGIVRDDPF